MPHSDPDPDELDAHVRAWQPLADRLGRRLSAEDVREIRRNLAALLLELRAAKQELEAAARDEEERPDAEEPPG